MLYYFVKIILRLFMNYDWTQSFLFFAIIQKPMEKSYWLFVEGTSLMLTADQYTEWHHSYPTLLCVRGGLVDHIIMKCENGSDWMLPQIVVQCKNGSDPMTSTSSVIRWKSCSLNSYDRCQGTYSWKILVLRVAPSNNIVRKFLEIWAFPLKIKVKVVKKKVNQKAS